MDAHRPGDGDPRKPFVLFGLGYLALVVTAVYLDYRYQKWRADKKRKAKKPEVK